MTDFGYVLAMVGTILAAAVAIGAVAVVLGQLL
jgi:hypothetical protein